MAAAAIMLLALLCGAGGVALRLQIIDPPEIDLTYRGVGLIAHTTNVPSCAIWFVPCSVQPLGPQNKMYAVWFVWEPASAIVEPRPNRRPRVTFIPPGARRLLALRLATP